MLDAFGGPGKGRREICNYLNETYKLDPWWISTLNIGYEAMHGTVEKDGKAKGYTICATKSIKASPDSCSAAFADANALDAWFGPEHQADMRDSGALSNADGNRASVKKVSPGKTIRLIWEQAAAAPGTPVEVKFQPAGAKTTVIITHDRLQSRADADGFRRAWGEALDRLKAFWKKPERSLVPAQKQSLADRINGVSNRFRNAGGLTPAGAAPRNDQMALPH